MFSRPWVSLLRRQILIRRRLIAFCLTVLAVLLLWRAYVGRTAPPAAVAVAAPTAAVSAGPGRAMLPVRFADGDLAELLRPGQRIDLWATDPRTGKSKPIARAALVVRVPEGPPHGVTGTRNGRLVVLDVTVADVTQVTTFGAESFLTYVYN